MNFPLGMAYFQGLWLLVFGRVPFFPNHLQQIQVFNSANPGFQPIESYEINTDFGKTDRGASRGHRKQSNAGPLGGNECREVLTWENSTLSKTYGYKYFGHHDVHSTFCWQKILDRKSGRELCR